MPFKQSDKTFIKEPCTSGDVKGAFLGLGAVLIVMFIAQTVHPPLTDILAFKGELVSQRPWTLLTSMFIHSSGEHLLHNLFPLILFGFILERIAGTRRFIAILLIAELASSIAVMQVYPHVRVLGASGAARGVVGAIAAMKPTLIVYWGAPLPVIVLGGIWLALDTAGVYGHAENIAYEGHLGGLLAGFFLGLVWRRSVMPFGREDEESSPEVDEETAEKWEDKYILNEHKRKI